MKRIRVLIATTEGPSEVQQIIEEDPDIRSVVCLDGTSEALPISRDYESFVRKPTGVVERLFGHPAYRFDVSHHISGGHSWQLGMLLAHALLANGRLAAKAETAGALVIATGEVRHNLDVAAVDHIAEKLQQARDTILDAVQHDVGVTILVPAANVGEAEAELQRLALPVDAVLIRGLGRWDARELRAAGLGGAAIGARRTALVATSTAAAIAAGAAILFGTWSRTEPENVTVLQALMTPPAREPAAEPGRPPAARPKPPQPTTAPAATAPPPPSRVSPTGVDLVAVELRPPPGHTCGGQRLTGGGLAETVVARDASGDFPARPAPQLCDVEFRIKNTAATAQHLWVHVRPNLEGTRPSTLEGVVEPGRMLAVRVGASPWSSGTPWEAKVIVAIAGKSPLKPPVDADVGKLTERLRTDGVPFETASYVASQPVSGRFK